MTTVRQLRAEKGQDVSSVRPNDSVFDAIEKMATENTGSLVVLDEGKLVGIITERLYAREVILKGKKISNDASSGSHVDPRNLRPAWANG